MQEKILYIRADGNEILGMGHFMRCFALATEWKKRYGTCCFLTSDEASCQVVNNHGFKAVNLGSSWKHLDSELNSLIQIIKRLNIRLLLVDSYYYSGHYIEEIKKYCKVSTIGDKTSVDCPADIVINYNVYAEKNSLTALQDGISYLLGTKYYPLREEFHKKRIAVSKPVERIYLSAGSTDPQGVLWRLAERLLAEGYFVEAVTGCFNQHLEHLAQIEQKYIHFHLHVDINNVSDIMGKCQLAVSAAGITLYELCAMGIPTIAFAFVDNQLPGVKAVLEKEIMFSVGDIRGHVDEKVNEIVEKIKVLEDKPQLRLNMSKRMAGYVDGKGAQRIIDIFAKQFDFCDDGEDEKHEL